MAKCPKCMNKLTKKIRDGIKIYECRRHGFVRNVHPTYQQAERKGKMHCVTAGMNSWQGDTAPAPWRRR